LSWFSCVTSYLADATFYAETITGSATASSHASVSLPSQTSGSSTEFSSNRTFLSTGAIVGIAIGGVALIALVVYLGWRLMSRKAKLATSAQVAEPDNNYGQSELPSQAVAEMSHNNCPKPARSPEIPAVVELPAVAYNEETEARHPSREEWPLYYRHDESRESWL